MARAGLVCRSRRGLWWVAVLLLAAVVREQGVADVRPSLEVTPDWRFITGGRIRLAPAISADGVLYCVSDDRLLRAVSDEGRELWRYSLGSRPAAGPLLLPDGGICVVTTDRLLVCVGPHGRERWSRILDSGTVVSPAVGRNGVLYLGLEGGILAALDYRGRDRWSFRFKAEIVGAPSVATDGTVYVSTADRLFHAVSPEGTQRWTFALPGDGGAPAIGSTGVVYVSAFGIHALSADGRLLWTFPVPSPTTDPVVARDGSGRSLEIVVVGARNGRLHVVDAEGSRVEEIELAASISLAPAIRADGALIVSSSAGLVRVRLGDPSGSVAFVRAKGPLGSCVLTSDGMAVAGSDDWVLYACSFGDRLPFAGNDPGVPSIYWPQPRHDAAQTARAVAGEPAESAAFLLLRELATTPQYSQKEAVLQAVRGHMEGERFLPLSASQLEGLLVFLSQEGGQNPVYVGERELTDHPELRARACALLGELGTEAARVALVAVVEKDPRGEVQSAAAQALGRVAYDPDGRSARALAALAERRRTEQGLLLVVVRALVGVARVAGPSLGLGDASPASGEEASLASRPAWRALVSIAAGRYPERARVAAREALSALVDEARRY